MSESAFIEGRVQTYRQSLDAFNNRLQEQQLNVHPVVGELVTEMQTRFQSLFDNPGQNYNTFNMSGRGDLSQLVGQTLERIEQTQPEVAGQLVDILFSPRNPKNQGEKIPLALPLYQELGLLYPTLNSASATFQRAFEARTQMVDLSRKPAAIVEQKGTAGLAQEQEATSRDAAIEIPKLRLERQADIQAFYSGQMVGEARDNFIAELRTNRALRLATIQQQYLQYEQIPPHEASSADWEKARLRFYDWGLICPGSSYIAGNETRADNVEERHGYPARLRRILGRIDTTVSVNVPFVLENQYRVGVNENRVSRAESRMSDAGVTFDDEGMNKFIDKLFEMLGAEASQSRSLPSYFNEPVVPRKS